MFSLKSRRGEDGRSLRPPEVDVQVDVLVLEVVDAGVHELEVAEQEDDEVYLEQKEGA